jgi:hypothetical protein
VLSDVLLAAFAVAQKSPSYPVAFVLEKHGLDVLQNIDCLGIGWNVKLLLVNGWLLTGKYNCRTEIVQVMRLLLAGLRMGNCGTVSAAVQ